MSTRSKAAAAAAADVKGKGKAAAAPAADVKGKGKAKAVVPKLLTLSAALAEVDANGGAEADGPSTLTCCVCFCDYAPAEVVQCLNPRKKHALCKDCFLQWFKTRGTGPFTGLTVAQARDVSVERVEAAHLRAILGLRE